MRPEGPTKSGIMVGAGETWDEALRTMADIAGTGCDILTVGQYLQPSPAHAPVLRYYPPEEFVELKRRGLEMGFRHVESGPLVRSSYHAAEQVDRASDIKGIDREGIRLA
jgi:lipoic acid synthetase